MSVCSVCGFYLCSIIITKYGLLFLTETRWLPVLLDVICRSVFLIHFGDKMQSYTCTCFYQSRYDRCNWYRHNNKVSLLLYSFNMIKCLIIIKVILSIDRRLVVKSIIPDTGHNLLRPTMIHHFLLNISIIVNTLCSSYNHTPQWKQPCFLFWKAPLLLKVSKHSQ